jgi:hypothetical protein
VTTVCATASPEACLAQELVEGLRLSWSAAGAAPSCSVTNERALARSVTSRPPPPLIRRCPACASAVSSARPP